MAQLISESNSPISIHALREESDNCHAAASLALGISIHALREESDVVRGLLRLPPLQFLSTLSVRRATPRIAPTPAQWHDFYPRSP